MDVDDYCPKTQDHKHQPDPNSIHVDYDGGEIYVDIYCKACGQSGCVSKLDLNEISW